MVGLEPGGQAPPLPDGGVAGGGDPHLVGGVDQVQVAHELAHAGDDLGGEPPAEGLDVLLRGVVAEDVLPQLGDGPPPDPLVDRRVHPVLDDPGHLVVLVGDHRVLPQVADQKVAEHLLGGDALQPRGGGDPRQHVPGLLLVGLGQHLLDGAELEGLAEQCGGKPHAPPPLFSAQGRDALRAPPFGRRAAWPPPRFSTISSPASPHG